MTKYVAAMFADRNKTLIKYQTDDGATGHCTFNPGIQQCRDILKQFSLIKLEENTINFERAEDLALQSLKKYNANKEKIDKILEEWDLFDHENTKFDRIHKILEEWNLFDHDNTKFDRLRRVVTDWDILSGSWNKMSKVALILKATEKDSGPNTVTKIAEILKHFEALKEWSGINQDDPNVKEQDVKKIFMKNRRQILEMIDKWDFIKNEPVNKDTPLQTEFVEKIVEKQVSKPINLKAIQRLERNKEDFFKLKLEIFEMSEVKGSKDRAWKAKMRKTTSTIALLGALNEGLEKMKSESNESQD